MRATRQASLGLVALVAIVAAALPSASALQRSNQSPACESTKRTLAMTPKGLTICSSSFGPADTMNRLAAAVTGRGMAILARIDHASAAAKVGLELRPTEVLMFGNPRAGTPLMQSAQTIGIDLPLKALVWQDQEGRTWLAYDDPSWLAERHGADTGTDQVLSAMTEVLAAVTTQATTQSTREAP